MFTCCCRGPQCPVCASPLTYKDGKLTCLDLDCGFIDLVEERKSVADWVEVRKPGEFIHQAHFELPKRKEKP